MATVEQYFIWFMIYSVAGWVYETILCSIAQKKFVNRGFLNGPYCPIYGAGAVAMIIALHEFTNPFVIFVLAALLASVIEYFTSWAMEKLFHARWWDYSGRKFNINGRVYLLGAVVFGSFGVVLLKVLQPAISGYTARIPAAAFHFLSASLFVLFLADNIVTITRMAGFAQKLQELSDEIEEYKAISAEAMKEYKEDVREVLSFGIENDERLDKVRESMERFREKTNFQERRMLNAFPKFKSARPRHNEALDEFKAFIEKLKKERKA